MRVTPSNSQILTWPYRRCPSGKSDFPERSVMMPACTVAAQAEQAGARSATASPKPLK
jgi:hypothetical protein